MPMKKEEFLQIVQEENIPKEWYSLDDGRSAPVELRGKSVYYGKCGFTNFLKDINYEVILEQLYKYRDEQNFLNSDAPIQVYGIRVDFKYWIEEFKENQRFRLKESSHEGEKDHKLLKDGWEFSHYDRYMGEWVYKKEAGVEIFTSLEISFKKKTTKTDEDTFGFKDPLLSTSVVYPIPDDLKEKIFKYISENKRTSILKDSTLWDEIINYFTIPGIVEDEFERLVLLEECYRNTLNYELQRQAYLGIVSRDELLEAYRSIKIDKIFSKFSVAFSRSNIVIDRIFDAAEEILLGRS